MRTQKQSCPCTCPAPSSLQRSMAKARSMAENTASASPAWEWRISCLKLSYITGSKKAKSCQFTCKRKAQTAQKTASYEMYRPLASDGSGQNKNRGKIERNRTKKGVNHQCAYLSPEQHFDDVSIQSNGAQFILQQTKPQYSEKRKARQSLKTFAITV